MKYLFHIFLYCHVFVLCAHCQKKSSARDYRGSVEREDSRLVVFDFRLVDSAGKKFAFIKNADEKIRIDDVTLKGDSLLMEMPVFESQFKAIFDADGTIHGQWIKGTALAAGFQNYRFLALPGQPRFESGAPPRANISGRWAVTLVRTDSSTRPAVAELKQRGSQLTGTMITPNSDYRFLEGIVRGDSMFLSTFDGAHSYLFSAKIDNDSTLSGGHYYAGFRGDEPFSAVKNSKAFIPEDLSAVYLKPGFEKLDFSFPDLDGKNVSIHDMRFVHKVMVVQLMGSWCPNCMDETAFLSKYYKANRKRGIEVVALAYENSTDFARSQKSLRKFQQRFIVDYPMLITGVSVNDTLRTEKTLPQLTRIKAFPTSILIDKKGKVRYISAGFLGPGTGEHYQEYIREFEKRVDDLLHE
jgi:thiol-disulfide isomerase/thioredoxin